MIKPTKNDLLKVMEKEPYLCSIGLANSLLCKREKIDLEKERGSLRNQVKEFQLSCEWLSLCKIRKTINRDIGMSYSLRRYSVRKWCGRYVSNGAFIAAVIHLNIPYRRYSDSINVHIAISSRSLSIPLILAIYST